MTRLKNPLRSGLALITLTVVSLGLCLNATLAETGVGSLQGRHLGQENKTRRHKRDEREENEARYRGPADHMHRFETHERAAIFAYYTNPGRGLPPGIAKRNGDLPPGLARQIRRNGVLPPGLQRRLELLPVQLEARLTTLPVGCGCRRALLGTNVVLIRTRTNFVLDVVHISRR